MNNTTKSAQFTPGPWVVNTFIVNGQHKLEVLDATGANACVQANATLIAAAPAMYAIIKDMREAFYVKGTRKALLEVMERSKDVLAQAEGRHHE